MSLDTKEFEKRFIELYETGISTTEICDILGENKYRGYSLLRKKKLPSNPKKSKKYTPDFLEKIKAEYLEGATVTELEKKYPDKKGSINAYLRKMGVTRKNGHRTKCKNIRYFENIDTPQKAYFLGFLYADGCVRHTNKGDHSYSIRLELQIKDKYILEELATVLESSLEVKEYTGTSHGHYKDKEYISKKHNAYFCLHSYEMAQDLIKWGCTPAKESHTSVPNIRKELIRYFILGFFDGDGIASVGKRTYIGFVGHKEMLESIVSTIEQETGVPAPNIYYNRFSHIYFVQYFRRDSKLALYHYLYDDVNIPHLYRKQDKLKQGLNIE